MDSANKHWTWLYSLIALGIFAVVAGSCLLLVKILPDPFGFAAFAAVIGLPPILMIVLVILARLDLDAGPFEPPKGELERLLERKRQGTLDKTASRRPDTAIKRSLPTTEPLTHIMTGAPEAGDALDRLVRRKRMGKLGRTA